MQELKIKNVLNILCSLTLLVLLSACDKLKVSDTEACAVAGRLKAGADCVHTLSDEERSMNLDELITWLEPQEAKVDPKSGKIISPERGAAICQSAADFNSNKTALEQACYALGNACSYEIKEAIKKMDKNTTSLLDRAKSKKMANNKK